VETLETALAHALKYSAESQKPVEVTLVETPTERVVTVKDYGIGIPADALKHVTQSFYRASNTTHYQGTGLGLSLSHRLVSIQGEQLTIESKQNQYTLCSLSLPTYLHGQ
jgi:signal transduction histidine kinase